MLFKDNEEVQWKVEFGEKGSKAYLKTSSLRMGKVCVRSGDGNLYCFSENGEMLWSEYIGGILRGLAYGERTLFATSEFEVLK
uniref:Uncharacterized protein n=1 Tax=Archaeoglobus fulgidus TaxID=2234 RepID=A0A7J2TKL5_ARCFL